MGNKRPTESAPPRLAFAEDEARWTETTPRGYFEDNEIFRENAMKPQYALVATMMIAASACASAQTMKPGLWEIESKIQAEGKLGREMAEAQRAMADMPPEQRKMMQEMMARQGVAIGDDGPRTVRTKVCMTKESVGRNEIPLQQDGCQHTAAPRSGNTMKILFTCTSPSSKGEGQITFVSPEVYIMKATMDTAAEGKPQRVDMDAEGKWLSADCGAIKPSRMPQ